MALVVPLAGKVPHAPAGLGVEVMLIVSPTAAVPSAFVDVTVTVEVLVPSAGMFCGLAVTVTVAAPAAVCVTVVEVVEAV